MKIQFRIPHLKIAGGTRVTLSYANQLARRGHDVSVIVISQDRIRRALGNWFAFKPAWQTTLAARIVRVASWDDAPLTDVIVADSWQVARALSTTRKNCRQYHLIQHDERLFHGGIDEVTAVYGLPIRKIAVSTWLRDMLQSDFGQEADLLLNPTDRKLFYPSAQKRAGQVRILVLEHDYPWKGTKEGVAAVMRLKKEMPHVRLILFGTRTSVAPSGFDERYLNPPQEQLRDIYSSADVFLCSSWSEGSGLPSMEAMACKTAVVTYDTGGSRDYAFHERTALVAKNRDTEDLYKNLRRIAQDSVLRDRLAQAGYEYVQSMPTLDEQTDVLERILAS